MPSNMPNGTIAVEALREAPHVMSGKEMLMGNAYRPWPARIRSMRDLTAHEKLFEFRLIDERVREAFVHQPGQFIELSIFGVFGLLIGLHLRRHFKGVNEFVEEEMEETGVL